MWNKAQYFKSCRTGEEERSLKGGDGVREEKSEETVAGYERDSMRIRRVSRESTQARGTGEIVGVHYGKE